MQDESTDVVSNADESMSERSPSTSSYVAEDDGIYRIIFLIFYILFG